MGTLLRFTVTVRICAAVTFLCYLVAGASFTLPSLTTCVRCAKQNHHAGIKAGSSCPLSYNKLGHDCHGSTGKASGAIKLCPDGCLRHDGQTGEVASLAKFISPPDACIPVMTPVIWLAFEQSLAIPTRSLAPPVPPPSLWS
jgi:hypothetical protein